MSDDRPWHPVDDELADTIEAERAKRERKRERRAAADLAADVAPVPLPDPDAPAAVVDGGTLDRLRDACGDIHGIDHEEHLARVAAEIERMKAIPLSRGRRADGLRL